MCIRYLKTMSLFILVIEYYISLNGLEVLFNSNLRGVASRLTIDTSYKPSNLFCNPSNNVLPFVNGTGRNLVKIKHFVGTVQGVEAPWPLAPV